jgi:hypothetical protein
MLKKLGTTAMIAAVTVMLSTGAALADTHKFTVDNKGGHQIDKVYLSPIGDDKWGPDQMGDDVIAPGASQTWNIETDCEMDIKVVYHDGDTEIKKDFDTCKYDLEMSY